MANPRSSRSASFSDFPSRIRGFLLDSQVDDSDHIAVLLGLTPLSDDVGERELRESDSRVEKVANLVPILHQYAQYMGNGLVEHQRAHLVEEQGEGADALVPPFAWAATKTMFTNIAFNTLLGGVSQLVDMNLLAVPGKEKRFLFKRLRK